MSLTIACSHLLVLLAAVGPCASSLKDGAHADGCSGQTADSDALAQLAKSYEDGWKNAKLRFLGRSVSRLEQVEVGATGDVNLTRRQMSPESFLHADVGDIGGTLRTSTSKDQICSFSKGEPAFEAWTSPTADRFDAFLQSLNDANIVFGACGGTFLGAYRHHGTIPFDEDMDGLFDLCENMGLLKQSSEFEHLETCDDVAKLIGQHKEHGTIKQFHEQVWSSLLSKLLEPKGVKLVEVVSYGLRLSNGARAWNGGLTSNPPSGVGVDFVIAARQPVPGALCKCTFGKAFLYCPVESFAALREHYGDDFMVPKSQCVYYKELGERGHHANWNSRSSEECKWASAGIRKM